MSLTILAIIILIISAVFHEFAHGWIAYKLGDNTAKNAGRLTLNPLKHLDPMGSVLLPVLLIISKAGFIIGWAKPVPYNPYNLRDTKYGDFKVALAGPGTNFIIALFFGIIARLIPVSFNLKQMLFINFLQDNNDFLLQNMQGSFLGSIYVLSIIIVFINLILAIFNLIPIPPLDGSKILSTFLPYNWRMKYLELEQYGMIVLMFLLILGIFSFVGPVVVYLSALIIGI